MISEGNLVRLVYPTYYFRNKISSLPEFLEKRFGGTARTILAFISALFMHIGMSLYAGALVFHAFFGINIITSLLVNLLKVPVHLNQKNINSNSLLYNLCSGRSIL